MIGNQGQAVVASLLANKAKAFKVRAITRDPSSEKALALSQSGAEVVKADGWNKQELLKAFEGSQAVFANTHSEDRVSIECYQSGFVLI